MPDPDGDLIFYMDYDDFQNTLTEKSKLYTESSPEYLFLHTLADVIRYNFEMYDRVYRYVDDLSQFDTSISQIKKKVEGKNKKHIFPDSDTFTKLAVEKESLKEKLLLLLDAIQLSYEMVEHLYQMMKSMNADTRIDSNVYERMSPEAEKVSEIHKKINKVFEKFPIKEYRQNLGATHKATKCFQGGSYKLGKATRCLAGSAPLANEIWPYLDVAVHEALEINFTDLFEATKKVRNIVNKALKVKVGKGKSIKKI